MPLSLRDLGNAQVSGERVTTLLPENHDTARSVRVIDAPDEGRLTVNPDNSLALVMTGSDYTGPLSFTIEVVADNGTTSRQTVNLEVTTPTQQAGWGTGVNHYMLETDAEGELIIETGAVHREVYVSGSEDALTRADIAALEGLSVSQITGRWLAEHPDYGNNPDMALAQDAGMLLWAEIAGGAADPASHWLRLETGYNYDLGGTQLSPRGIKGESPLHPMVITSYGEGDQPVISGDVYFMGDAFNNVVIRDLHVTEPVQLFGSSPDHTNIILDSMTGTREASLVAQNVDGVTLRNSNFHDILPDAPRNGGDWHVFDDRVQAVYAQIVEGLLIENTNFAQTGWEEGYDYWGDSAYPKPPSMFNQAVYVQNDNLDVTFRDNILAQAASFGAQIRSGGFIEDNLFLDNNAALSTLGGDYLGAGAIGNYSLLTGNVVTSAGYREANYIGALSLGIQNQAIDTVLLDNIVTHLADPNDPADLEEKYYNHGGLHNRFEPVYDDTIVYRWYGGWDLDFGTNIEALNRNIDGLDRDLLDQTTAANLARIILNDPNAGIDELVDWIKVNEVTADTLNAYFQEAFGILQDMRTTATELRFIPNELGDGVRWDNRINWSTEDLPGSVAGDSVDLGGNLVVYGGTNTISALDFGSNGRLEVSHGRLNVTGQTTAGAEGASIDITSAGQIWLAGGYTGTGMLDVTMDGGRFANTGTITGNVNLTIENGQALLSAEGGDFTFGQGGELIIRGGDAELGFDGALNRQGIISLEQGSAIRFASDASGLGEIGEFRSGAYGNAPQVNSRIEFGGADFTVDLSGAWLPIGSYDLMRADQIVGDIGSFSISGLGSRAATLLVDYDQDLVQLQIASGSGVSVVTRGDDAGALPPVVDDPVEGEDPVVDVTPEPEGPEVAAGLVADYFVIAPGTSWLSQIDFTSPPDATAVVDAIDHAQGIDPFWEDGPADNFAARYTGALQVETAGRYTLYLTSDDGSALYLDGAQVIDNDGAHATTIREVTLDMEAGAHALEILYFERAGHQTLQFEWQGPDSGGVRQTIDGAALAQTTAPVQPEPVVDVTPEPEGPEVAAGLVADYFVIAPGTSWLSQIDFTSPPDATAVVDAIDHAQGIDPFWEDGPADNFAARYTGALQVETAGRYTLYLTSDDGSALYLDGAQVIDNDGAHATTTREVTLDMEAGAHALEILYFERTGHQTLQFEWQGPDSGGVRQTIDGAAVDTDLFQIEFDSWGL